MEDYAILDRASSRGERKKFSEFLRWFHKSKGRAGTIVQASDDHDGEDASAQGRRLRSKRETLTINTRSEGLHLKGRPSHPVLASPVLGDVLWEMVVPLSPNYVSMRLPTNRRYCLN